MIKYLTLLCIVSVSFCNGQVVPSYVTITDSLLFSSLNLDYPGLEDVKTAVLNNDFYTAKNAYYIFRLTKSKSLWLSEPIKKTEHVIGYDTRRADSLCQHFLGPGNAFDPPNYFMGNNLNWIYNPMDSTKESYTLEWVYSLNRMTYWNHLIDAYLHTSNEKYPKEWIYEMEDWVAKNPVPLNLSIYETLNWRGLEAGIRMTSWINAYYSFIAAPSFTADANFVFVKGVLAHGWRLNKLSSDFTKYTEGNNHNIISNIGLANVSILFPELKESEEWKSNATRVLDNCLKEMVYPDGVQFELAPGYHQWVRDFFLKYARLTTLNKLTLPEGYMERLKKMYYFGLYAMDPQGKLPPINDSRASDADLKEAATFWKDPQFEYAATKGKKGIAPTITSYKFNYAGFNIMRSGWDSNAHYLFFKNGPVGAAHQHEDDLNILINAYGKSLLTEGQTYMYDASKFRYYVLTTPAHNTITIDGLSQNRTDIESEKIAIKPNEQPWVTSPILDYAAGVYNCGYQKLEYVKKGYHPIKAVGKRDSSIFHTRNVIFLKPFYYLVTDLLQGKGEHTFDAYYHLDAPATNNNEKFYEVNSINEGDAQLALWAIDKANLQTKVVIGQTNPILGWIPGKKKKIPTIIYTKKQMAPVTFATLLYPYQNKLPIINTTLLNKGEDTWACSGETDYEKFEVSIARKENSTVEFSGNDISKFTTSARMTVNRKKKGSPFLWTELVNVSSFLSNEFSFKCDFISQILIVKEGNKLVIHNPTDKSILMNCSTPFKKCVEIHPKEWLQVTNDKMILENPISFLDE